MRRLRFAGAVAGPMALSLAGCYWLASYQDLLSGNGDAGSDSGGEARAAAEGATGEGGTFCPPDLGAYTYCMDFDGVDAAVLGLQAFEADAGITGAQWVSPPSSFFVKLDGPDAGTSAAYDVAFPFTPTTSRLEFQINVAALDPSVVTTLGISLYDAATQTWQSLNLLVTPQGAFQMQEYFDGPNGALSSFSDGTFPADGGALGPTGTWHHVVLSLTTNDATAEYTSGLTVDGQVLEDDVPLQGPWAQGPATISVGSSFSLTGGSLIYFDNIRADFGL